MDDQAPDRVFIAAVAHATRIFADSLDAALALTDGREVTAGVRKGQGPATSLAPSRIWDPLVSPTNELPYQPRVHGNAEERKMKDLVYLSAIWAINARENRGATAVEVRTYARKAGYSSAKGVTAWSKGNGGTTNEEDGRWITPAGEGWMRDHAREFNINLPSD